MQPVLLFLLALSFLFSADGNKVKFVIKDGQSNPIANASATAIWKITPNLRTHKSCITNNEGTCEVYGVPNQKDVIISGEAEGFTKKDGTINVNGDTDAPLTLTRGR